MLFRSIILAVRFSPESDSSSGAVASRATTDDEEGLDQFFADHRFEFVDGNRGGRKPTHDGGGADDEDSSGMFVLYFGVR